MINARNKVLYTIIFSFSYVIFVIVGLRFMAKTNYYSILYTLKGDYVVDKEVSFGMNFLGGFINWSDLNTYIPFFEDNFLILSNIISYTYFFSHWIILIGWILFFLSSDKKIKKLASRISFFIYLGIYILLIFYMPVRLDRMVDQANLKYIELEVINPEITNHILSSSAPYCEIFIWFPIISLIVFYLINYISFQKLIEKFAFILKREIFFRDFYEKVIKKYNENQYWDIKETLEWWNKGTPPLVKEEKQIKFCEIVSSFANSKGGFIIIGISNSFPREIIGIPYIEDRMKDLEEKLLKRVRFEKKFYRLKEILLPNEKNQMKRCIVLLIFQTKKPISVEQTNGTFSYKKRLGSGSVLTDGLKLIKEKRDISKLNIDFLEEMIKEYDLSY
ncbi:hypothetical protein ES705_09006 [subsurface metagenome]